VALLEVGSPLPGGKVGELMKEHFRVVVHVILRVSTLDESDGETLLVTLPGASK
jgi:hypothetical protein